MHFWKHTGTMNLPGRSFDGRNWFATIVDQNGVEIAQTFGGSQEEAARLATAIIGLLDASEIALVYLEDGAPNTAADRLRDAVTGVTMAATRRPETPTSDGCPGCADLSSRNEFPHHASVCYLSKEIA